MFTDMKKTITRGKGLLLCAGLKLISLCSFIIAAAAALLKIIRRVSFQRFFFIRSQDIALKIEVSSQNLTKKKRTNSNVVNHPHRRTSFLQSLCEE